MEQIVEQVRVASGADFAFVLTRKGRLVTSRAPRDMPDEGRERLVRAARPLLGTDRVVELTLPREDLVPYGGAAPVDVYLAVAAEQAIVCIVMASWADKMRVGSALAAGIKSIEPLLRRGLPARRSSDVEPAKGVPFPGEGRALTNIPPPNEFPVPAPPRAPPLPTVATPRVSSVQLSRGVSSVPEIHVAEAELGHLSMVAIRHDVDAGGSVPDIVYSETHLGRGSMVAIGRELIGAASAPEIILQGEATLGRETMVAIDQDGKPRATSTPDAIRVELVSMPDLAGAENGANTRAREEPAGRSTVPWVEHAADAKRAADAATVARKLAVPKVTLKLDDADESVLDAARAEVTAAASPGARADAPTSPPNIPTMASARPHQVTIAYEGAPPKPLPPKTAKR